MSSFSHWDWWPWRHTTCDWSIVGTRILMCASWECDSNSVTVWYHAIGSRVTEHIVTLLESHPETRICDDQIFFSSNERYSSSKRSSKTTTDMCPKNHRYLRVPTKTGTLERLCKHGRESTYKRRAVLWSRWTELCDLPLVDFFADWSMFRNQLTSNEVDKKQVVAQARRSAARCWLLM